MRLANGWPGRSANGAVVIRLSSRSRDGAVPMRRVIAERLDGDLAPPRDSGWTFASTLLLRRCARCDWV